MKFKSVYVYVFLFLFCAFSFNSGAGGGAEPKLIFTSWKAGQGVNAGPWDPNGSVPLKPLWKTFITNTETTCNLKVGVGYAKKQPPNAYKITRHEWKVAGKILLPGLSKEELKQHTFTFTQKTDSSAGAGSSGFSYSGDGKLSAHWKPSGGKTARRKHCPNFSGTKSPDKGRKLQIDVTFIGYYGTDPNNEKSVSISLPLSQDQKDRMRQEYLDQRATQKANKPNDSAMGVPPRSDFSASNDYSDAHGYDYMIDKNLADKKKHWAQACDKHVGEILKKDHRIKDLHKTGAYRNAHHHLYHVVPSINSKTAFRSFHQYGLALDVRTVDMDGDGKIENTKATKWVDSKYMADAAKDYAGAGYRKWDYSDGHVHAQWAGNSKSSTRKVSQKPKEKTETPTPAPSLHVCGVHPSSQSGDHSLQASCSETDSYGQSCTVTSFYACQSHTHQYPALITGACGHTYTSGSAYNHRSVTCPTNSHGDSCILGTSYFCSPHTHQYPAPTISCGRAACKQTVSSPNEHRETCAAGHRWWSCNQGNYNWNYNHHRVRTCRRAGCGQSWQRCTRPANARTPRCLVLPQGCWAR